MIIGNKQFDLTEHFYIMGILNITPDSFSDGGRKDWNDMKSILKRVEKMIEQGADIIDVGGQTTQIGYTEIDAELEIKRVMPVIKEIKRCFDIPISIDTYRSKVASRVIQAGVDMVNDIWGLKYDDQMPKIVAESGVVYCLTHNCAEPNMENFLKRVYADLNNQIEKAASAGITKEKIIIDIGISLGKTAEQNLLLLNNLRCFQNLHYPMLLGVSRKNFMNNVWKSEPTQRIEMTIAANVIGLMNGCTFFRVHDIEENRKALLMAQAIKNAVE